MQRVPFNVPTLVGRELEFIGAAVDAMQLSGNGGFGRRCEAWLEQALGAPKVLMTTSCTHALELAALLLEVGDSDEVIVPSFTFVSTANAFALRGCRLVFADVRPDTLNLDEQSLDRLITDRTKVIVPVHYAGIGCDMAPILRIAASHGVRVIEDNAHGLFGRFDGRALGTAGCLAALSFHETKNCMCGEGGALVVNDDSFADRAEIIRDKGTDRSRFLKGAVDKYTWVDLGSSYALSDMLAAFLYAQFEKSEEIQARRRAIWDFYAQHLGEWAERHGIGLPVVPSSCTPAYHLYYLVLPSERDRDALIAHLDRLGVASVAHYMPLHLSRMGRRFGGKPGDCPVTERVCGRLVRLPFNNSITDSDLARVVENVTTFLPCSG